MFDTVIRGPFGTKDKPVGVPSVQGYRVVGCTGGKHEEAHDINWIEVRTGENSTCVVCGQVFCIEKVH